MAVIEESWTAVIDTARTDESLHPTWGEVMRNKRNTRPFLGRMTRGWWVVLYEGSGGFCGLLFEFEFALCVVGWRRIGFCLDFG